jgi:2-polyprenyl-3-methyl-5-hydroxy-6-metoxy-1,4-benzoquinol methylase
MLQSEIVSGRGFCSRRSSTATCNLLHQIPLPPHRFDSMNKMAPDQIAKAFLPDRGHYYYARIKLSTDPVYAAARSALAATALPVLDIGCGIGLLSHSLAVANVVTSYLGVDHDAAKLGVARAAAKRKSLDDARFEVCDLTHGRLPCHPGNVVILDVLHYLAPDTQGELLRSAVSQLVPGAKLIIRTGLGDRSWRARLTHFTDRLGHSISWMKSPPLWYPQRQQILDALKDSGLRVEFQPMWGRTPFNNWLVIAQ